MPLQPSLSASPSSLLSLPLPGSASAPSFRPAEPRSIVRFFEDLDFVFARSQVDDAVLQKRLACRYVPIDVEELWKTLPEAAESSPASFEEFRDAVFALYPEVSCSRSFSFSDLERLVDEWQSREIASLADYGEFYRSFLAIAGALRKKDALGRAEEGRLFRRALGSPELRSKIDFRLQIVHSDRHLDDVFTREEIHQAAVFVLSRTSSAPSLGRSSAQYPQPVVPPSTVPPASSVAQLTFSSDHRLPSCLSSTTGAHRPPPLLAENCIRSVISSQQSSAADKTTLECHYCGAVGCFVRSCPVAQADVEAGRCRRNEDGRIVLWSGRFIPRALPGRTMRERMLEWYHRQAVRSSEHPAVQAVDSLSMWQASSRANQQGDADSDVKWTVASAAGSAMPSSDRQATTAVASRRLGAVPSPSMSNPSRGLGTLVATAQRAEERSQPLVETHKTSKRVAFIDEQSWPATSQSLSVPAVERSSSGRIQEGSVAQELMLRVERDCLDLQRSQAHAVPRCSTAEESASLREQVACMDNEIAELRRWSPSTSCDQDTLAANSDTLETSSEPPSSSSTREEDEARAKGAEIIERVFQRMLKASIALPVEDIVRLCPASLADRLQSSSDCTKRASIQDDLTSKETEVDSHHVQASFLALRNDRPAVMRSLSPVNTPSFTCMSGSPPSPSVASKLITRSLRSPFNPARSHSPRPPPYTPQSQEVQTMRVDGYQ